MLGHGQELTKNDYIHRRTLRPPQLSVSTSNGFAATLRRKFSNFRARRLSNFDLRRSKSLNGHIITTLQPVEIQNANSRSLTDLSLFEERLSSFGTAMMENISIQPIEEGLGNGMKEEREAFELPKTEGRHSSIATTNVIVPQLLQQGTPMTKVSSKKHKKFVFRLDADLGQIVWESKKRKIIPIENIKEIRSGDDGRYYREQFQLSQAYQDRWLTIVYLLDGNYKTLHLIASTKDAFRMWDRTLRDLYAIRSELMRGLGNVEMREALWEKHYWKGAKEEEGQKLTFEEVEKLCRKLNINSDSEDLLRLFKEADTRKRHFLDFDDFRRFVKLLKARPEVNKLYNKLKTGNGGVFDFKVFERFMRERQESTLTSLELSRIFHKYVRSSTSVGASKETPGIEITVEGFTSFLLSLDNSVFADQHKDTWQDMTRPLPEYFISSSHNTYLVGHQLVGVSTIEGYIRALLHGCRSVELDIYDGEQEPMIFHGKTFTSKVSLREVCQTIAKYGFIASPYPIIISAEVHCGLAGQDLIAAIMIEEFGDSLIRFPVDPSGDVDVRQKIEHLPSPEELRGKILLKAKDLSLRAGLAETDIGATSVFTTDPSSSTDSDVFFEMKNGAVPGWTSKEDMVKQSRKQFSDSTVMDQLMRARTNILRHVRSVGKSSTHAHEEPLHSSPTALRRVVLPPLLAQGPLPPSISVITSTSSTSSDSSTRRLSDVSASDRRPPKAKPKMSPALLALLVYTVGVKFRGINKKEESRYAPEHVFSLSENTANKQLRFGMWDLIKHTKSHLVRTYPKGLRLNSTNYEPHRFWAAGAQLVAINWQTFDLGYMINHAMFQRNGRSGYVLKPEAIRLGQKDRLAKKTLHDLAVTIISAQQLPQPKNASGHELPEKAIVDPYVEVTLYVPDWPVVVDAKSKEKEKGKEREGSKAETGSSCEQKSRPTPAAAAAHAAAATLLPIALPGAAAGSSSVPRRSISARTSVVRKNGWNPMWHEKLRIPFDCVGDMMDLIFVRFLVKQDGAEGEEPLAVYCASLGTLQHGDTIFSLHVDDGMC